MESVKKTKEYNIYKKKSGRYAVKNAKGQPINKEEKIKILLSEKLIKLSPKKAAETTEAPAAE